jgi:hypothetical protein
MANIEEQASAVRMTCDREKSPALVSGFDYIPLLVAKWLLNS